VQKLLIKTKLALKKGANKKPNTPSPLGGSQKGGPIKRGCTSNYPKLSYKKITKN
jgi:hypothetical protein